MDKRKKPGSPASPKNRLPSEKPTVKKPVRKTAFTGKPLFLVLVILALTFVVFLPVFSSDFLSTWDDSDYITNNLMIRAINFQTLKAMFSSQIGGTYVPLPLLSYAIEYKLFGLSPTAFHLTNLLIHLLCTLCVFDIFRRLGIKPLYAAMGALLFGVHPMGVESVAWVTERKDLLYTFFYLASIIAYLDYLKKENRKFIHLGVSWGLFLLALFSKIQAVSLPLVLLAVDFYMRRPVRLKLLVEKIPFFILSLGFGIAGIFILKHMGALKINEMYTLQERLFFGSYAFCAYIIKFFAPAGLSALYPYPIKTGETLPVVYYVSPLLIGILAFVTWKSFQKGRSIVFGVLFFTLSVFFLLQIFGAGQGFMADRYTKIPYVGLIFILIFQAQYYLDNHRNRKTLVFPVIAVVIAGFMVLSYHRTGVWKNGDTLWTDVIEKYPDKNSRPYACRGLYYREHGMQEKALSDFSKDLELDPGDVEILQFRGNIYFSRGRDDSAYADYTRALRLGQDNALALANLGAIYVRRNQYDSAMINLSKALEKDTSQYTAYANRAVVYGAIGRPDESIADFKSYLKSKPDDERVIFSIGMIYFNRGQTGESITWFNRAIAIKPGFANYHWMRSQAFRQTGNKAEALKDAVSALDLGMQVPPDYIKSLK